MLFAADCDVMAGSVPGSVTPTDRTLDLSSVLQRALLEANGWVTLEEVLSMLPEFRQEEIMSTIETAMSENLCETKFYVDGTKIFRALGAEFRFAPLGEIEVLAPADARAPPADETQHAVSMMATLTVPEDLVGLSVNEVSAQVAPLSPPPQVLVGDADPLASTAQQTSPQPSDLGNARHLQSGESDCAMTGTASECGSVDGVPKVGEEEARQTHLRSCAALMMATKRAVRPHL